MGLQQPESGTIMLVETRHFREVWRDLEYLQNSSCRAVLKRVLSVFSPPKIWPFSTIKYMVTFLGLYTAAILVQLERLFAPPSLEREDRLFK